MTRDELMTILPHRDGMLLLDEAWLEGDEAHGVLHIRGDEWFLQGHFPGDPIVPGVILCEILAQSACVLLKDKAGADKQCLYTSLNNVRFKSSVRPGDRFETTVRIIRAKAPFYFAEGSGYVDGRLCVKAEFSFAVMERESCSQKS